MHALLFHRQNAFADDDLHAYAEKVGLDVATRDIATGSALRCAHESVVTKARPMRRASARRASTSRPFATTASRMTS